MQTQNRLFDDLAKVANGAVSTLVGVKDEIEAMVRQQIDRLLADMDLVPRDEFEAVKAMAAKAREEQERLEARIADMERRMASCAAAPPPKPRSAAKAPRAEKPKG